MIHAALDVAVPLLVIELHDIGYVYAQRAQVAQFFQLGNGRPRVREGGALAPVKSKVNERRDD